MKNREVTWTTLELTGILEDEDSHVHFTRTLKHLALHPYYLNNVQRSLNQILKSSLNSYDNSLKGFVLAFRNPKLLSNLGKMLFDSPFIHIDIEADFYLFRPTIGSFLKGIVKKKGLDHIVVLVHKIYTVSIPKPDDVEEWAGDLVEIGQEVKCCVSQIDNKSKPPFICGTLRSDYSEGCRLSESINNIDNVDSAIENTNNTVKTEVNGILDDDDLSEKEKKKQRKKYKKSRESNSNLKVENESDTNLENDSFRIIKSEKKQQSMQDTILKTDDSFNNLEIDNISKKHKRSKKTSKSLLSDDTVLNEYTELRKTVKRENAIPLDSIIETETKKRKKHSKKSKEHQIQEFSDLENEKKVIINIEDTIRCIKSEEEEQHTYKKHITSNTDLFSNNLEDSVSKKHKKNKKAAMIMSNSESEDHIVKIKIEKHDPFFNENLEMPKLVKREVSIEYDSFEKERKKSPKKHTETSRDSQSTPIKIKNQFLMNDVSDTSDREKKKSPKKHTDVSRDSDSEFKDELRIKSEYITNDINDISRTIKRDPEEFKYNISAIDSSLNNSDLDNEPKKSKKKKKTSTILSDSESKYPVKVKTEKI